MIKIKCDLCKKDVDGNIPEDYFKLIPIGRHKVTSINYEFCEKCYCKILNFIEDNKK